MGDREFQGVMTSAYAKGRLSKPELRYRLRVRARAAFEAMQSHELLNANHSRVLELGAADGRTLLEIWTLLDGRGEFDGIEYAQELIDEAPKLPENMRLLKGDIHAFPSSVADREYDMVTALAVLEHVEDPLLVVQNAFDVLDDGGIFVATSPSPVWDNIAGALGMVADEHHTVEVTLDLMKEWAREVGFRKITTQPFMWVATGTLAYAGLAPDPAVSLKIDRLISRIPGARNVFVNQILVAQK